MRIFAPWIRIHEIEDLLDPALEPYHRSLDRCILLFFIHLHVFVNTRAIAVDLLVWPLNHNYFLP